MPTYYDDAGEVAASTTFIDAKGRGYINGVEVPARAWEEHQALCAEVGYMRAALERIASGGGWFAKDSGGRQRLAREALEGAWRP